MTRIDVVMIHRNLILDSAKMLDNLLEFLTDVLACTNYIDAIVGSTSYFIDIIL